MSPERRFRCRHCGDITGEQERLLAPHPFLKGATISGCPKCKEISEFEELCDEPTCLEAAGCGFPSENGYRRTCRNHFGERAE